MRTTLPFIVLAVFTVQTVFCSNTSVFPSGNDVDPTRSEYTGDGISPDNVAQSATRGDIIEDDDDGTVSYDGSLKSYSDADNGTAINLTNKSGMEIVWSYTASSSGTYTITLRYTRKASMNSSVDMSVNGSSSELSLPETSSSEFSTTSFTSTLNSGENSIVLTTNASGESADIDWIQISGGDSGDGDDDTYTLSTSVSPSGAGSISLSPSGGSYDAGTQVTLTATASSGYTFSSWSGDASGSSSSVTITMDEDKSVTASFSSDGSGDGDANYDMIGWATENGGTTGGAGGVTVTCSDGECIEDALYDKKKGNITDPLIIYVNGTITESNSSESKINVKEVEDVSIIGVGSSGTFNGIGIKIYKSSNIIIQNVTVHHVDIGDKDAISIEGPADHIWIDHCELYAEYDGADKDYYDGLLDAKKDAEYITYSYNYLHDSWKTMLVGSSDSDDEDRKITAHHNYFDNCNSRMPLFRFGNGHFFNNYYSGVVSTGINSRMGACLKVENNYFKDSHNPIVSAYSDELGGVEESGSVYDNVTWDLSGDDVSEPETCTATVPYSYSSSLNSTSDVPSVVVANVGVGKISTSSSSLNAVELKSGTSGELENALSDEFTAYPNPVGDVLSLDIPELYGDEVLRVVSLAGKEVLKTRITETSVELDVKDLPNGTYILQLRGGGHTCLKMIVKE